MFKFENTKRSIVAVKKIIASKRAHKARMEQIQKTHDRAMEGIDEIFKNLRK